MATDVIGNAIIAVAAIIIVTVLISGLIPNIYNAATGISSTASSANDQVTTSALVTNYYIAGPGLVEFDVLNNGRNSLPESAIDMTVLYMDNETMPSNMVTPGESGAAQYWNYTIIERDSSGYTNGKWDPGETLVISVVSPGYSYTPGNYKLKMLLYNNAICQYGFEL